MTGSLLSALFFSSPISSLFLLLASFFLPQLLAPMKSHERIFVDEAVVTVCHFAQNSAVKLKRSGSSSPPTPETFEVRWLRLGRLEGYTVAGEGGWIFDRNPITGRQMLEPVVTASEKASASIVES